MRKYPLSLLKDKNIVTFFDFWGKTRRGEKDGGDDYHLLCWHSLDVAAMGYLMVKRNCFGLADYFRQLGISDKEQAAQFFAWLLCWHDIGKFARSGNDSNLLIVFYVQIMPDDFVMQLHRF